MSKLALLVILFTFGFQLAMADTNALIYEISGNTKTNKSIIESELVSFGAKTTEDIEQVLLSTGLFSTVKATETSENKFAIEVAEKWTTIPIFKFNSGGGAKQFIFGVYDPNVLGERIELGAQYETLEGAPSFVLWNKNPRLFNSLFFYDLQLWNTKRIRLKYDQDLNSPLITKALLLQTEKLYFAFGKEFLNNTKIRTSLERQIDKFSTDLVPQKFLDQTIGQIIPDDVKTTLIGLQFDYSKLKSTRNVQTGSSTSLSYKLGLVDSNSNQNFNALKFDYLYYDFVGSDLLFSQRVQLGLTDTNILQHWNYLGGLESIRGFADNRFASKNYWLSNSELRHFTFENPNYIAQSVVFVDALGIDESDRSIQNITALSGGIGARFIFPKIYRLILRIDYAKPIVNEDEQFLNFGIQQFF